MGHDGPGHLAIADGRPVARALKLYHGKSGAGLSIEMKVRLGPVTILGVTQTADGRLKLIAAEGESIAGPDVPDRQHELAHPLRVRPDGVLRRLVRGGPDAPRRARRRPPARRASARSRTCSGSSSPSWDSPFLEYARCEMAKELHEPREESAGRRAGNHRVRLVAAQARPRRRRLDRRPRAPA